MRHRDGQAGRWGEGRAAEEPDEAKDKREAL